MAALSATESQESERDVELRIATILIPTESVRAMAKMAVEEQIGQRLQFMMKHWHSCGKQSEAKLDVRVQFVKCMDHFVIFQDRCIEFVGSRRGNMIRFLKRRVPPFSMCFGWCRKMYQGGYIVEIFRDDHIEWVRRKLLLTRRDVLIAAERKFKYPRCDEMSLPSSSDDSSDPNDDRYPWPQEDDAKSS